MGILRNIVTCLLMFSAIESYAQCTTYNITVSFGFWPSEVSWQLLNASNTIVASGFAGANQSVCLPDGCYTFAMIDSFGDGWNGAAFSITNPSLVVVASGTLGTGYYGTSAVPLGPVNCCPPGTSSFTINVTSGLFPGEISWQLLDLGGVAYAFGGAPYNSSICLPPGCYQFVMSDFWGDGWDGAVYSFIENGITVASGTLINGSGGTDLVSLGGVSCSPTCGPGQLAYYFEVSQGLSPAEQSWSIVSPLGTTVASGGAPWAGFICVTEECQTLNLMDSWGDGWEGGEYFLYDENFNLVQQGTLSFGTLLTTQLEIGSADCGITNPVTASDCSEAVNICENFNFQINPNGEGSVYEIPPLGSFGNPLLSSWDAVPSPWGSNNDGCLQNNELNSTWMIINIWQGGSLNFTFGGNGTQAGFYDWIMYPYDSISGCSNIIGNTLAPVRCNWNWSSTGGTGLQTVIPPGGSTGNFEPPLNVLTGQQYIICFSNWSSAATAVPLDFGGSAVVGCYPLILPVQLLSFEGQPLNFSAQLAWSTASEQNNDYFDIEFLNAQHEWEIVGRVEGAGNSNEQLNYGFIHRNTLNGYNYYRLKQVDENGTTTHSDVVSIWIDKSLNVVYPNPNDGKFTSSWDPSTISIYDALGRAVAFEVIHNHEIRLTNHAAGFYTIIENVDGQTLRLLVE
ncbi:MAG: T9SS type A sorting domain-containing protein [Flavobacteriales bacterium]